MTVSKVFNHSRSCGDQEHEPLSEIMEREEKESKTRDQTNEENKVNTAGLSERLYKKIISSFKAIVLFRLQLLYCLPSRDLQNLPTFLERRRREHLFLSLFRLKPPGREWHLKNPRLLRVRGRKKVITLFIAIILT